jgi:hypothetical protein
MQGGGLPSHTSRKYFVLSINVGADMLVNAGFDAAPPAPIFQPLGAVVPLPARIRNLSPFFDGWSLSTFLSARPVQLHE